MKLCLTCHIYMESNIGCFIVTFLFTLHGCASQTFTCYNDLRIHLKVSVSNFVDGLCQYLPKMHNGLTDLWRRICVLNCESSTLHVSDMFLNNDSSSPVTEDDGQLFSADS